MRKPQKNMADVVPSVADGMVTVRLFISILTPES